MSGPKCASWSVAENQRLIELARRQALGMADDLAQRAEALAERVREVRERYGEGLAQISHRPPEPPDREEQQATIDRRISELQAYITTVNEELTRVVAVHETRLLLREISEVSARVGGSEHSGPKDSPGPTSGQQREAEVLRILGRVPASVPEQALRSLQQLAKDIIYSAESGRAESLTLELRRRVQQLNDEAKAMAWSAARATDLRTRLRGLEGEEVSRLDAELAQVERYELHLRATIEDEVEAVSAVARRRVDQVYAAAVMKEELIRLGYTVEEDFETLFVVGGNTYLQNPKLKDYRVITDVDPETNRMKVRLGRIGAANASVTQEQRRRDQYMEEVWCQDFASFLAALGRHRIEGRVIERVPPGGEPVPIIEASEVRRQARQEALRTRRL